MNKVAVWAGVIVVAAAVGNAIDSTPTDTTIPSAPVTAEQTTTTSTVPVIDTTTSATEPNTGGVPTGPGLPSGSPKKSPRTTTAVQDDEVDCNNWEDYVDSGEYDIEDIADICGLDDSEIDDYENG